MKVSLDHNEGETSWTRIDGSLKIIFICEVAFNDINLAGLRPENELLRKNMLVGEIE